MNWLLNIFDSIKWRLEDAVWSIKDKITLWRELRQVEKGFDISGVEEIEAKPKKKKVKKKSAKKTKKSV